MFSLVLTLVSLSLTSASFCGDSAIPYSFEVLPDGQPILGCARPNCFGWTPNGQPASHTASFYKINQRPDGFLREGHSPGDDVIQEYSQTANCESTFQSTSCHEETQWVAGIAPLINTTAYPTILQCCSYERLRLSVDRGVATVAGGQIVVGGEVTRHGRQISFDYIAGLSKTVSSDGEAVYDVTIRRFPCVPPMEGRQRIQVSPKVSKTPSRAYQTPTFSENVLPPPSTAIEGPFPENSVNAEYSQPQIEQQPPSNNVGFGQQLGDIFAAQAPQAHPMNAYPQQNNIFGQPAIQPMGYAAPPNQYVAPPFPGAGQYPVPPPVNMPAAPVMQPVYYPAQSVAGTGGGSNGYYCFSGDTMVRLFDGSEKRMDEVEIDDWLQTINQTDIMYSPVTFWLHKMPRQQAEFRKLELFDGSILKITSKHYIYKTTCSEGAKLNVSDINREAVFAENVVEGDCVYRINEDDSVTRTKVVKVSTVKETGIYSPMTSNGKIVVNGVLASCHNIVQSHTLQHSFFTHVDNFKRAYAYIFGSTEGSTDLPMGLDVIMSMMEYLVPKNLVTL